MKKNHVKTIGFVLLFTAVLFSCSMGASGPDVDSGKGMINIKLPDSASGSQRAMTPALAEENADSFEIIVYNDSFNTSVMHSSDDSGPYSLIVPAGTYNVLCLAGHSAGTNNDYYLFGSGISTGVTVAEKETTTTSITLASIDFNLAVPTEVNCSEDYTISVTGNTNSAYLEINTNHNAVSVSINDHSNYIYLTENTSGQSWDYSTTLTAPGAPTDMTAMFTSNFGFSLVDSGYSINENLYSYTTGSWHLFNDVYTPTASLLAEVKKSFSVVAPADPTEIDVNVTWQ